MSDEVREDVGKAIRAAIFFAVPVIVVLLVAYTIFARDMQ